MDETQPMALRTSTYRELAQYVTPKRKALEHKGEMAANFRASEAQRSTPASWAGDI
jgi:hypothetical protein